MKQWKESYARFIGLSHIQDKIPCQDFSCANSNGEFHVIVLSDGCGSSKYSEHGSELIGKILSKYLEDNFDRLYQQNELEIKKELTKFIVASIDRLVEKSNALLDGYANSEEGKQKYRALRSYPVAKYISKESLDKLYFRMMFDATVQFVAVKGDRFLAGHCGDGYMLYLDGGALKVLSMEPKTGAENETTYPSTIVAFVEATGTEKEYDAFRIIKGSVGDIEGFVLMSDGAEHRLVKYEKDKRTPAANNVSLLFEIVNNEEPDKAHEYLEGLLENEYRQDYNGQEITDDDVSVAIMVTPNSAINSVISSNNVKETVKSNNSGLIVNEKAELTNSEKTIILILLGLGKKSYDADKFEWLIKLLGGLIKVLPYNSMTEKDAFEYVLKNIDPNIDEDDFKQLRVYLKHCGIIDDNFKYVGGNR